MSGTLTFRWDAARTQQRIRRACHDTLDELGHDAYQWWRLVVPVRTGHLRDAWFSEVRGDSVHVMLVFGAGTASNPVPYVLFIELGTGLMPPRAPIRQTAGEIVPLVLPKLRQKLPQNASRYGRTRRAA